MKKNSIADIRQEFIKLLEKEEYTILAGNVKTVEIVDADFYIMPDEDTIFGKPNYEYINRELAWYDSMSLCVDDIPGETPTIWKNISSTTAHEINSNYGWCIYHKDNFEQYKNCLAQLLADNSSRRACMIYTRPSMQYDYNRDGMSDFMCTYATQQFIRDIDGTPTLVYSVLMRSNDVVFGFRNDLAHHRNVAKRLIKDLKDNGVKVADEPLIHWHACSLHVYERHFHLIK